jgi:DNA-binding transcriptional LysR family regulator
MDNISVSDLKCFVSVAESLSINKSATELHVAQSHLSKKIKDLESELKINLLNREVNRIISLTETGKAFYEEAIAIINSFEYGIRRINDIKLKENLIVSFTSSMSNNEKLLNILVKFKRDHSETNLVMMEDNSGIQLDNIRNKKADIAFVYENIKQKQLREDVKLKPINLEEEFIVVLPEQHRLRDKSEIPLSALKTENFIIPRFQDDAGLAPKINALFSHCDFEPKVTQKALFMVTILGMVAAGIGISILPSSVQNLGRKNVIYRPIKEKTIANDLYVIWRDDNFSINLRNFKKVISDITKTSFQDP